MKQDAENLWSTEGIIIFAAGIDMIYVYSFKSATKEIIQSVHVETTSDVGSYLSIMQLIKHPLLQDSEESQPNLEYEISLICGTVQGNFNHFNINFDFDVEPERMLDQPQIFGHHIERKFEDESIISDYSHDNSKKGGFSKFKG